MTATPLTRRLFSRADHAGYPPSLRGLGLGVLLLAASVAACDTSGPGGEDSDPTSFSAAALKSAYDTAWIAKDPAAFAASYAEDADYVGPLGNLLPGREAIRAQHAVLFSGPFVGSVSTSAVRRTTSLSETVAMVDLDVALTGYAGRPPGLPEVTPGVVRMRVKWVVVRREGRWEIASQQMTALPPAP